MRVLNGGPAGIVRTKDAEARAVRHAVRGDEKLRRLVEREVERQDNENPNQEPSP